MSFSISFGVQQPSLNAFCFCPIFISNVFVSCGGPVNTSRRKFIRAKLRSAESQTHKVHLVFEAGVSNSIFRESLSRFCALNVPCDDLCEFRVRHVDRWTQHQRPLPVTFFTLMLGHFPQNICSIAQTKNSFIN